MEVLAGASENWGSGFFVLLLSILGILISRSTALVPIA